MAPTKKRDPKCAKCLNHGIKTVMKDHKRDCRLKDDHFKICHPCRKTLRRQHIMSDQVWFKRNQTSKESNDKLWIDRQKMTEHRDKNFAILKEEAYREYKKEEEKIPIYSKIIEELGEDQAFIGAMYCLVEHMMKEKESSRRPDFNTEQEIEFKSIEIETRFMNLLKPPKKPDNLEDSD